jgi:hypothetical protein
VPLAAALQRLTALAPSGALCAEQTEDGLDKTFVILLRDYAP